MNAFTTSAVCALLLGALPAAACGSASSQQDGPPVPDPGGPFNTSVSPAAAIDELTVVETDTLCRDLAAAFYGFLSGAVETQMLCRMTATQATSEALLGSDGGLDGGALIASEMSICSSLYEECLDAEPRTGEFVCPIPISSFDPQQCSATVEDLSACLNEIAALDPVARCVLQPGCDAGFPPSGVSSIADGGDAPAGAVLDGGSQLPPTPACARLSRICPGLEGWATFPCSVPSAGATVVLGDP